MQLIAPDELAKLLNVRGANSVLQSAATKATSDVERSLQTSLPRSVRRDTFRIDGVTRFVERDHMRAVLSAGIVDLSQPITATWAQTHKSDPVPLDIEDVVIDPVTGYVRLYEAAAQDGYLVIEYTAGLPQDPKNPGTLVGAPQWMLDAFTLLTGDYYLRDDEEKAQDKHSDAKVKAAGLLANHLRVQQDAFYPVSVEAELALTSDPM